MKTAGDEAKKGIETTQDLFVVEVLNYERVSECVTTVKR